MNIDFKLQEIEDKEVRENFFRLKKAIIKEPFLKGNWGFFEIAIPMAVTNFKYKHSLGFQPKDIIQTSSIGAGVLQFNYSLFDATSLDITTTGPVTVRAFVGRFDPNLES